MGELSDPDLRRLYARAAVYAATSLYEPFGLAPVEAALSRCAIVANDIPTFRELWQDSVLYFRRNDPRNLCETLERVLNDSNLQQRYGELAYQRALNLFTAERMVDDYCALYASLVEPRGSQTNTARVATQGAELVS
jgi:glycosyltransferase involved in cell wall biosynthesis